MHPAAQASTRLLPTAAEQTEVIWPLGPSGDIQCSLLVHKQAAASDLIKSRELTKQEFLYPYVRIELMQSI